MKHKNVSRMVFDSSELFAIKELLGNAATTFEKGSVVDAWILEYRETQDPVILDAILRQMMKYIVFLSKKYKTPSIDVRDLILEAVISVIEVINTSYKVDGHQKFITYIKTVVERKVKDYCDTVNQAVKLPKNIKSQQGKLKAKGSHKGTIYSKINFQSTKYLAVFKGVCTIDDSTANKKLDIESLKYDISRVLDKILDSTERYVVIYTYGLKYDIIKSRNTIAKDLDMSIKDIEATRVEAIRKIQSNDKAKGLLIKYLDNLNA